MLPCARALPVLGGRKEQELNINYHFAAFATLKASSRLKS